MAAPAQSIAPSPGGGEQRNSSPAGMSHREILSAMSGLLLGLFVAILSSTIVTNALPTILNKLHGGESAYTWIVAGALLSLTATTPIWGKLADLFSKKLLVQIALIIYVAGSLVAGLSTNVGMLIACRVVQGIGAGGMSALAQICIAAMVSPRERGRYSGYTGAVFAVATVAGPLIGGTIVDTAWLGWRWCFYVGAPFAVVAIILLQKTLHLPVSKKKVKIDYWGAAVIAAATVLLLVWVTLAGQKYDWISWQTFVMVPGAIVLYALAVWVELKVENPIVPLNMFKYRTVTLAVVGSLMVGVGMYSATTFLSQYFQLGRDKSPTMSGVFTIPLVIGLALAAAVVGKIITKRGKWKVFLILGTALITAGFGLLGMARWDTPYWQVAIYMALAGLGVGMTMQNMVLAVQNTVPVHELGAGSAIVTFFRTLGGAIGVSALGAVLANRVTHYTTDNLISGHVPPSAIAGMQGSAIPDLKAIPAAVRPLIEDAYGHGIGDIFLIAAPCAFIAFLVVWFIKEVPLRTLSATQRAATGDAPEAAAAGAVPAAVPASASASVLSSASASASAPVAAGAGAGSESLVGSRMVEHPQSAAPYHQPYGTLTDSGVQGTVRAGDGSPVVGATVTLIDPNGRQIGRSITKHDGYYALDTPGAGQFVLIGSAVGHQPEAATIAVGDLPLDYDLRLSGSGGLAGTVRAAGDAGSAVAGALVVATDARGEVVGSAVTGADGGFRFGDLVPGPYTLAVSAAGYRPNAVPAEVAGGQADLVEAELLPAAAVRGVVRHRDSGEPLADAKVTLLDAAGNAVETVLTDASGEYAFARLDGDSYTVVAAGYAPTATQVTLTGKGQEGLDLTLTHEN
ncbi:MFS transporter [Phaeacidiphilus oryzae]|uniref:MFS transporter n=1 Tax=Phaeacidiphilus oryzae TaxID=348818 RepID=UPI001F2EC614|nr:MFS transporter [Phaeacidiphilus oryzae]